MDTIQVSARDFNMKAKKLRAQGLIPGSVFGGPLKEAISLQIPEASVQKMLGQKRVGSRLELELDGKKIPVQLKEVDRDPLQVNVLQVSFQALQADQKVNSVVHVLLKNAEQFTSAVLEQLLVEIPYSALPHDMIDTVTIDVEGMPVDTVVRICDIPELQSDKIEIQGDPEDIVFRIVEKKSNEEEPAEEAEE